MCTFLFLTVKIATGIKQDELLQIILRIVNLDALFTKDPLTIYGSYIHFRKNLISWKKLGMDPKVASSVLVTFPIPNVVCCHDVAIRFVSK